MYQVMWTTEIWLGTRWKSAHASTAQMALSMCSSRYCSTFAPHFFLYFWAVVVFLGFFKFSFYFFDIFSSLRSTKEVPIENMRLNKWKVWPVEYSEDVLKIDKKLVTTKIGSCDQFLKKNQIFWTQQSWISILSTRLSCWPIHVPSTRCIKWCEQQKYY